MKLTIYAPTSENPNIFEIEYLDSNSKELVYRERDAQHSTHVNLAEVSYFAVTKGDQSA